MRALLVSAALIAATLSLPTSAPAYAEAATCLGLPATIEATTGIVSGTPGPDVIAVSGSVTQVLAGDGDDVVCVVGNTVPVFVSADGPGVGSDWVDASAATAPISVSIGKGADHFLGGLYPDSVFVNVLDNVDTEGLLDVISTGDGSDYLFGAGPINADLGPGNDKMQFFQTAGSAPSQLDLGRGHDELLTGYGAFLAIDLHRHTLDSHGIRSQLNHAEDITAAGRHVVLRGDGDENDFRVIGCRVELHGGRGNDTLTQLSNNDDLGGAFTCMRRARIYGDGGNDSLRGNNGNDTLIGGPGRDTANGGTGTDRCVAERLRHCER